MNNFTPRIMARLVRVGLTILGGLLGVAVILLGLPSHAASVHAANEVTATSYDASPPALQGIDDITITHVITPGDGGYPKLDLSTKTVTPTLGSTDGVTLYYTIQIRNTGSYTAENVILTDTLPADVTYNNDVQSSPGFTATFDSFNKALTGTGVVGFDSTVVVSFSVKVAPAFNGVISNTAIIRGPLIANPVTVTAQSVITDNPILVIAKTSTPAKPGANKKLMMISGGTSSIRWLSATQAC